MTPRARPSHTTTDRIDYANITAEHPWITSKGQLAVLSRDADGFLCALFLCYYLRWRVVGFYDEKVLVLRKGLRAEQCVFLDVDIFRPSVRSIGQHMLLYNKKKIPPNWDQFKQCIQPNSIRRLDVTSDFRHKYPFATIHLLLGIVGPQIKIEIRDSAIEPLSFADGSWQNLLRYPENTCNWLEYLGATDKASPLYPLFCSEERSLYPSMKRMVEFYAKRDAMSAPRERGDRLTLTDNKGTPYNVISKGGSYAVREEPRKRAEQFISMVGDLTGWRYESGQWECWENLNLYRFTKENKKPLNNTTFGEVLARNPLSFAVTAATKNRALEYTLEAPDRLP